LSRDLAEIIAMEPVSEPAVAEMSRPVIARTALSLPDRTSVVGEVSKRVAKLRKNHLGTSHVIQKARGASIENDRAFQEIGVENGRDI